MKIQAYDVFQGVLQVTIATPRPEATPSTQYAAASIHEDYVAKVRAVLWEWKQCGESSQQVPAAKRLQTYFPANNGQPLYALRTLVPAGAPRDIDNDYMIEIMRIRYDFVMVDLQPPNEKAEARERAIEKAVHDLFVSQGVPDVFIPGDSGVRDEKSSVIDIIVEMGPAVGGRRPWDIGQPS